MPCRRIGRSTSTTPWSKSISITRSAITHSRPIETCWKAEIVHSWPSTVFAPISHSPSWTRIFVPWPSHDQRPSLQHRVAADLELDAGRDEAQPVGLQARAPAQLQPRPARDQPGVVEVEHAVAAQEARERQRTAVERLRHAVDGRRGSGPGHRCHRRLRLSSAAGWRTPWPTGFSAATSARWRAGISLVEDDDPDGLGARQGDLPAHRQRVDRRLHRPARRGQVDADRRADQASARAGPRDRGALDRPVVAVSRRRAARRPDPADASTSWTRASSSARWRRAARWAGWPRRRCRPRC